MVKAPNYSGTNATYQAFTVSDAAETDKARAPMKKSAGGGFTGAASGADPGHRRGDHSPAFADP